MEVYEPHVHPDPSFPIIAHFDAVDAAGIFTHWHESLEILYVVEGEMTAVIDSENINAGASDMIIVNSNCLHTIYSRSGWAKYYCLIIDKKICAEFGIFFEENFFKELINDNMAKAKLEEIIDEFASKKALYKQSIKSNIISLLIHLYRNHTIFNHIPADSQHNLKKEYIRSALKYMQENFCSNLSISDISTNTGLSKFYFCRMFKEITGYTAVSYINRLRCYEAKKLLRTGKYTVSEVAPRCGFENLSYFTKTYKKHIGNLPSDDGSL